MLLKLKVNIDQQTCLKATLKEPLTYVFEHLKEKKQYAASRRFDVKQADKASSPKPIPVIGHYIASLHLYKPGRQFFLSWDLIVICLCGLLVYRPVTAADPIIAANAGKHLRDAAKFRFEMDNDIFFGSDNQYSNGLNFRIHSANYRDWQAMEGMPVWIKSVGANLPSLQGDGLVYRTGFSVGQVLNTPSDIKRETPIDNDVPYVGLLAGQISWVAFNDREFRGFEVTLGTIGRSSLGEQGQNIIHTLTGSEIAQGWDNQVGDELALNLNYMRKWKLGAPPPGQAQNWDIAFSGAAALGNVFTHLEAGLEFRIGDNLPGGFAPMPELIGRTIGYDASLPPAETNRRSLYGTVSASLVYYFHQLPLEGSIFSDKHGSYVDILPLVGNANFGLHYETPRWGLHLNSVITTDTIDVDKLHNNEDKKNRFLSFTVEWKIS